MTSEEGRDRLAALGLAPESLTEMRGALVYIPGENLVRLERRLDAAERTVQAIRELHAPVPQRRGTDGPVMWLNCEGCDLGPHPEDYPTWPCRTAELVYTADEIKAYP